MDRKAQSISMIFNSKILVFAFGGAILGYMFTQSGRGAIIGGIIGIIICPWWLLDEISGFLIFVSGLLGPVLGILLCDYFVIRKKKLNLSALYQTVGEYTYKSGFNPAAMIALTVGVLLALIGYWLPALSFLYNLSWFTGFIVSFILYLALYKLSMMKP